MFNTKIPSCESACWDLPTKSCSHAINTTVTEWYHIIEHSSWPMKRNICSYSGLYDLLQRLTLTWTTDLLGKEAARVFLQLVKAAVETSVLPDILGPQAGLCSLVDESCTGQEESVVKGKRKKYNKWQGLSWANTSCSSGLSSSSRDDPNQQCVDMVLAKRSKCTLTYLSQIWATTSGCRWHSPACASICHFNSVSTAPLYSLSRWAALSEASHARDCKAVKAIWPCAVLMVDLAGHHKILSEHDDIWEPEKKRFRARWATLNYSW